MQRCAGTQRLWYMQQFQIMLVKALLFPPLYLKEIIKLNQRREKKKRKRTRNSSLFVQNIAILSTDKNT